MQRARWQIDSPLYESIKKRLPNRYYWQHERQVVSRRILGMELLPGDKFVSAVQCRLHSIVAEIGSYQNYDQEGINSTAMDKHMQIMRTPRRSKM